LVIVIIIIVCCLQIYSIHKLRASLVNKQNNHIIFLLFSIHKWFITRNIMDDNMKLFYLFIAAGVFLVLFFIGLIIFCCIRHRKSDSVKKRVPGSSSKRNHNHKDVIIKVTNEDGQMATADPAKIDTEVFKYLGVSLSEIPFIDDSKCSSCVDLSSSSHTSWNLSTSYKPLK